MPPPGLPAVIGVKRYQFVGEDGNVKMVCSCGTLVWDCPPGHEPKFSEDIVCYSCGQRHLNRPAPWYQIWCLKQAIKRFRRRFQRARRSIMSLGGHI